MPAFFSSFNCVASFHGDFMWSELSVWGEYGPDPNPATITRLIITTKAAAFHPRWVQAAFQAFSFEWNGPVLAAGLVAPTGTRIRAAAWQSAWPLLSLGDHQPLISLSLLVALTNAGTDVMLSASTQARAIIGYLTWFAYGTSMCVGPGKKKHLDNCFLRELSRALLALKGTICEGHQGVVVCFNPRELAQPAIWELHFIQSDLDFRSEICYRSQSVPHFRWFVAFGSLWLPKCTLSSICYSPPLDSPSSRIILPDIISRLFRQPAW